MDHFLARAIFDDLRFGVAQIERLAEQFDGFAELVGGLAFISEPSSAATSSTEFAPRLMAMRLCEPIVLMASGKRRHDAIDGGLLEQQRLATAGRFHFAVGDFGDFEFGGDGLGNALEFARAVELGDEIAKGFKSHTPAKLTESRQGAIAGAPASGYPNLQHQKINRD